jgi:hypothetical protein
MLFINPLSDYRRTTHSIALRFPSHAETLSPHITTPHLITTSNNQITMVDFRNPPWSSAKGKGKGKEREKDEKKKDARTISAPVSMCPQCRNLHFDGVCSSCGYRNGLNEQQSDDDSDVSPKTRTKAQQAKDQAQLGRHARSMAPSSVLPSDSVSNDGTGYRNYHPSHHFGYGATPATSTHREAGPSSSVPEQRGRDTDFSRPGTHEWRPQNLHETNPAKPMPSVWRPERTGEIELQNMEEVDIEAARESRSWAPNSKGPRSWCRKIKQNLKGDWIGLTVCTVAILGVIIGFGVFNEYYSHASH